MRKSLVSLIIVASLFWLLQTLLPETITIPVPEPTISPSPLPSSSPLLNSAKVMRVIDGDTIEVENGLKIRYIGIDTPELQSRGRQEQCFAKEAKNKNRELVEGKIIRLEKDVSETDRFGRLLRYVYLDNVLINEYLVKEGFAFAATFPPDVKYADLFLKSQQEAREQNKGMWKICRN